MSTAERTAEAPEARPSEADRPELSIVVPTYDRPGLALESLAAWLRQQGELPSLEVVLVDDGGSEENHRRLQAAVAADPRVRLLRRANGGQAAARNTGLDAARGDWLLFADDDVSPIDKGALARWWARARSGDEAWVGAIEVPPEASVTPLQRAWKAHLEGGVARLRDGARLGPSGFWVAAMLIPRQALHGQRFEERLAAYGWEDLEMGLRLHGKGSRVRLAKDANLWHSDRIDLPTLLAKRASLGRQAWALRELHPGLRTAWWTGTLTPLRWLKQLLGVEARGRAALKRIREVADVPAPPERQADEARFARGLWWALEGAYAGGVRQGLADRGGAAAQGGKP